MSLSVVDPWTLQHVLRDNPERTPMTPPALKPQHRRTAFERVACDRRDIVAQALWQDREDDIVAITPKGRLGEPVDTGRLVAFLASDATWWIIGQMLAVGGRRMFLAPIGGDQPGSLHRSPGSNAAGAPETRWGENE